MPESWIFELGWAEGVHECGHLNKKCMQAMALQTNFQTEQITLKSLSLSCRRDLRSGSKEVFVATTAIDLGKLLKVRVSHTAFTDRWFLDKIEITKFGTEEK